MPEAAEQTSDRVNVGLTLFRSALKAASSDHSRALALTCGAVDAWKAEPVSSVEVAMSQLAGDPALGEILDMAIAAASDGPLRQLFAAAKDDQSLLSKRVNALDATDKALEESDVDVARRELVALLSDPSDNVPLDRFLIELQRYSNMALGAGRGDEAQVLIDQFADQMALVSPTPRRSAHDLLTARESAEQIRSSLLLRRAAGADGEASRRLLLAAKFSLGAHSAAATATNVHLALARLAANSLSERFEAAKEAGRLSQDVEQRRAAASVLAEIGDEFAQADAKTQAQRAYEAAKALFSAGGFAEQVLAMEVALNHIPTADLRGRAPETVVQQDGATEGGGGGVAT